VVDRDARLSCFGLLLLFKLYCYPNRVETVDAPTATHTQPRKRRVRVQEEAEVTLVQMTFRTRCVWSGSFGLVQK
jgi:hypothetical protein